MSFWIDDAFSRSLMSVDSLIMSAFLRKRASLASARRFLRALASATFLMGRASSSFIFVRHKAMSSLLSDCDGIRCLVSSSWNQSGRPPASLKA